MADDRSEEETRPPNPATTSNTFSKRPGVYDVLALWTLEAARFGRRKFSHRNEQCRSEYYDRFFEKKDYEAYALDPRMAVRRQTIAAFLTAHVPPGANIIDVGCGLGDVLAGLPDLYRLHGVEYSSANVRSAEQRLAGRTVIRQGSICQLPVPPGSMDICLCLEVLEHVEQDGQAVEEIHRILTAGGLLIAAVPYTYYWPQYLRLLGHYRHYDRESFRRLLEQGGFSVTTFLPNYPAWHQAFTRRYVTLRALVLLFGRLFGEQSVYRFRWPWSGSPAIQNLEKRLNLLRQRDATRDYRLLSTSTFVVARKR